MAVKTFVETWRSLRGLKQAIQRARPEPAHSEVRARVNGADLVATVSRHELGAPIITANDTLSGYFGLGWAMSRDRFFQMDLARRIAYGRFSEMIGDLPLPADAQLFGAKRLSDIDLFLRSFRFENDARRQAALIHGDVAAELYAFVAGVNQSLHGEDALPPEYLLLGRPTPWTVQDTIALSMSAGLLLDIGSLEHEFLINGLLSHGKGAVAAALYKQTAVEIPTPATTSPFFAPRTPKAGGGSNAWAVSGDRTANGKPILASDPHLPLSPIPTFWYHAILRTPELNISGLTFAGTPSFAIGHNGHAAWGATASQRDAFDTTRVRVSDDLSMWLSPDGWVPTEAHEVTIPRRLALARKETIYTTPFGTLFPTWKSWDGSTIAVRMAGASHTDAMPGGNSQAWYEGMRTIMRSRSWEEHREGLRGMNHGNLGIHHIYADVDGTIAHQTYGMHPKRPDDQGVVPRASWEANAAWRGYLSLDELPHSVNPERGFVLSANAEPEREIGGQWPYIAAVFEPPYRYDTLRRTLENNKVADVELFRQMQLDTFSAPAPGMRDVICAHVRPRHEADRAALAMLRAWDGCYDANSGAAAVFEHVLRRGARHAWETLLGAEAGARFCMSRVHARRFADLVIDNEDPLRAQLYAANSSVDAVLDRAFHDAVDALTRLLGDQPHLWRLDAAQRVHLIHPLGAIPIVGKLFDIGAFPVAGSEFSPLAHAAVVSGDALSVAIGPVSRFICDLSDPERGFWAQSSGASGRAGSTFYASTTMAWLRGTLYEARTRAAQLRG